MVELECIYAGVVATLATPAALVLDGLQSDLLATPPYRVNQVGPAICVAPPVHPPYRPSHSHLLYQLSYRGILKTVQSLKYKVQS